MTTIPILPMAGVAVGSALILSSLAWTAIRPTPVSKYAGIVMDEIEDRDLLDLESLHVAPNLIYVFRRLRKFRCGARGPECYDTIINEVDRLLTLEERIVKNEIVPALDDLERAIGMMHPMTVAIDHLKQTVVDVPEMQAELDDICDILTDEVNAHIDKVTNHIHAHHFC